MTNVSDIRKTFIDFFKKNGHEVVRSSPLVPHNDPTMMFTNSGMVQFKNIFTGQETRPYTRATTAQKCVRAGGKHNDLDNVGFTARHLTFFEMLGNFSFGDYFKADAIPFAWELMTKHFDLPPDRLLVTVYHNDDEAAALWKKVTGFSNSEEEAVGLSDIVPFLLEDVLKQNGGIYSRGDDWGVHVVEDDLLITGQNPASSEEAAKRLLAKLT